MLRRLALREFRRCKREFLNTDALMRRDSATQVRLPFVCEDIPVVIELGRRESNIQFEFSRVGRAPLNNPPDFAASRGRAKGNERQRRAAVFWPLILL